MVVSTVGKVVLGGIILGGWVTLALFIASSVRRYEGGSILLWGLFVGTYGFLGFMLFLYPGPVVNALGRFTVVALFVVVVAISWLALPLLVAADTRRREGESALLWGLFVTIYGLLGLALYLYHRPAGTAGESDDGRETDREGPRRTRDSSEVVLPSADSGE
jgi:hypothetical protein